MDLATLTFRARRKLRYIYADLTARDFARKVRWRMMRDRNPVFSTLQDKYAVKAFARARGVASAGVFYVGDRPAPLPFGSFPRNYFLKASHGWNWNISGEDGRFFFYGTAHLNDDRTARFTSDTVKRELPREVVQALADTWLETVYSPQEWAYSQIPRRIIVEEALEPLDGDELLDYRFYTFGGRVRAIEVDSASVREAGEQRQVFFADPTWREIDLTNEVKFRRKPAEPPNLAELIGAAERLGEGLDFVRVDLYNTVKGPMLGEMTLYPEGGVPGTPTRCGAFNRWLGAQWVLDKRYAAGTRGLRGAAHP